MSTFSVQNIAWKTLLHDMMNPRLEEPASSTQVSLDSLMSQHGPAIYNLAKSIAKDNFVPAENLVVTRESSGQLVVRDGNRRLAALSLVEDHDLAKHYLTAVKANALRKALGTKSLPNDVSCLVFNAGWNEEVAKTVSRIHSGEQGGAGHTPWSAIQKERYADRYGLKPGKYPKAMAVLHWLEEVSGRPVTGTTNISTIERLLAIEVQEKLGLHVTPAGDVSIHSDYDEVDVRTCLEAIVDQISNGALKVDAIKTKPVREAYLKNNLDIVPSKKRSNGNFTQVYSRTNPRERQPNIELNSSEVLDDRKGPQVPLLAGSNDTSINVPIEDKRKKTPKPRLDASLKPRGFQPASINKIDRLIEELHSLNPAKQPNAGAMLVRSIVDITFRELYQAEHIIRPSFEALRKTQKERCSTCRQGGGAPPLGEKISHVLQWLEREKMLEHQSSRVVLTELSDLLKMYAVDLPNSVLHDQLSVMDPQRLRSCWELTYTHLLEPLWRLIHNAQCKPS